MQFMVSRRLVRLGGVDPPYRQKKRAATAVAYILCLSSLSCPSFIERLLELAEFWCKIWPILLILLFQMEPRET